MPKIFIGVGHGGKDAGATANGFKEADLNLSIALACRNVLQAHGVTVGMSRTKDENDTTEEAVKECNEFAPDFAIDIHNNAGGGDGAEIFHTHAGGKGKTLAANVLEAITKHTGQNSRGIKTRTNSSGRDYYAFIRETKAPAIIVECAFVDNKKDIQIIDTAAELAAMGEAIAIGVLKTLGITYKATADQSATDNVPDNYAAEAVKWAVGAGILKGDDEGNYKLHSTVTRQDVIVFLHRALKGG